LRTIIGSLKRMRTNFVGLLGCLLLHLNLIIDQLPDVITHQICFVHSSEQKKRRLWLILLYQRWSATTRPSYFIFTLKSTPKSRQTRYFVIVGKRGPRKCTSSHVTAQH
jgi:hypothetical protein